MSPRLEIFSGVFRGGVPDVKTCTLPDVTGEYDTPIGKTVLDMSGINPSNQVQRVRLFDREIQISAKTGVGSSQVTIEDPAFGRPHRYAVRVVFDKPIREPGEWKRIRRSEGIRGRNEVRRVMWIPKPQHNEF